MSGGGGDQKLHWRNTTEGSPMASPLTSKQKQSLSSILEAACLEHDRACTVSSKWDPDLVVSIDGTEVTFHAADRSITVGDNTIEGDGHKGVGFMTRMVDTVIEMTSVSGTPAPSPAAPPAPAEADEAPAGPTDEEKAAARGRAAPPPPSSVAPISISRGRPGRPARRVEQVDSHWDIGS
jgi:hypothetical protein